MGSFFKPRQGEGRKTFPFILLALLWSIGSYGTFTLSEGMFLENIGTELLPQSYLAIACTLCVFSVLLIFSLNRFSIRYLLTGLISLWILSNFVFLLLYYTEVSQLKSYWFIYKVMGWVTPLSTYIVYWAFVDQYFDLQDGKRFFCQFNSILFLGDAIAGGVISFLFKYLEVDGLILFFIGTMILSLPFIFLISSTVRPVLEEHSENIDTTSSLSLKTLIQRVLKSKYTLYLLLFYFSMQLLVVTTEYNYMESFERAFSGRPEKELTEFLGRCGMWIALLNMFFGIWFYGRLVKKIGINNIIIIAPSVFCVLFSAWICKDALPIAVFAMIMREMMAYSFDDNNLNLLISGVPSKVKNQVRIFVESFIEPSAMFSTAFFLLLFQTKVAFLGFLLSLISFGVVILLRIYYPRAIFQNLAATTIRFEKKAADWLAQLSPKVKKQAEFLLLSNLKNQTDEKGQLLAYECLLKLGNPRILPRILDHINALSLPGKLKAIELLNDSPWAKHSLVIRQLKRWRLLFPHSSIKSGIHFHFARHCLLHPEQIADDLNSQHLGLRGAAILSLKKDIQYQLLASENLRVLLDSKNEQEICIGLKILGFENNPQNISFIFPYLNHPSPTISVRAAQSIALIADPSHKEYSKALINHLFVARDFKVRLFCLNALEKMISPDSVKELILATVHFRSSERKQVERIVLTVGKPAIPTLLEIMKGEKEHDRCRLLAGKILSQLDLLSLRKELSSIINAEIERAYFYFYHSHTVQQQVPQHDLSILVNTLMTRYHSIIDFIIQLVGNGCAIKESEVLSYTLRSKNRKIRGQAIESLEKACDPRVFALLEPLIDERHPEQKLHHYLKGGRMPFNLTQLLDALSDSPSLADQVVSIGLKRSLKTADWKKTLSQNLENKEKGLRSFSHAFLNL
ncbi:MAG: MFS transporter [Chlamydiales bacterium]